MPYLSEASKFWAKIWRLEINTPAQGGDPSFTSDGEDNIVPSGGFDNIQGKQLADRTLNLHNRLLTLENQLLNARVTALENYGVGDIVKKAYHPANLLSLPDYKFDGVLWMRGQILSRTTYSRLFAKVEHQLSETGFFRPGDGSTTFQLADLRGEFLRAWDGGRGVDDGREFGTWQEDEFKSHMHRIKDTSTPDDNGDIIGGFDTTTNVNQDDGKYVDTQLTGGAETRPKNRATIICVRY